MLSIVSIAVSRHELNEIINPGSIVFGDGKLFIYDSSGVICAYSAKDFKMVNKFGRQGTGPGEFMIRPGILPALYYYNGQVMVDGISKVAFFSPEGKLLREIKKERPSLGYYPLGEKFAAKSVVNGAEGTLLAYIFCDVKDNRFFKTKEFFKFESVFQPRDLSKGFNPLNQFSQRFYCQHNRVFICGEDGVIKVFDDNGNKQFEIKKDFGKLMVTDALKEQVFEFYKTHPGTKPVFKILKERMKFPAHFPLVRDVFVADQKIFVLPYAKEKMQNIFFVFDLTGKFIGKQISPIRDKDIFEVNPYTIKDGKIYQLIENSDEESWVVSVTSYK